MFDDENEDILVQIHEEKKTISTTFRPEASSGREKVPFPYLRKPPGETLCKLSFFFVYLY